MLYSFKSFIHENKQNNLNCECCKYFDFSTITRQYNCVEKPLYFLIYKGVKCELTTISPESYLEAAAQAFQLDYYTFRNEHSVELVNNYVRAMKKGSQFPIPFYSTNDSGQEGRHRALAAQKLGCNSIPVVKITYLNKHEIDEWALFFSEMSREQIDQFFQNEFNLYGTTPLGFKDLNRKLDQLSREK